MQRFYLCGLSILTLALTMAAVEPARAVGTSYFTQSSEADFKTGTLDNIVATNLGDLKLSRAVKTVLDQDPHVNSVTALAEAPDGTIYAGAGPNGTLFQIKDGKVAGKTTIADAAAILSLVAAKDGAVILGTAGDAGRVIQIDKPGDKPHTLFEAEGVHYVWGLVQTSDGNIYAATGPHGQLFEIKPDGSKRMLLQSDEGNLLSMISDGKDNLYVGTDPHGLVYRVNRTTGESFVLYNCAESEVSALALDKKGNLYAGTSEAKEEPAAPEAGAEQNGRLESGASGVPIPADRPNEPTPPPPPNPNPGQPRPIPKDADDAKHARLLMHRRTTGNVQLAMQWTRGTRALAPSPLYSGERVGVRGEIASSAGRQTINLGPAPALADGTVRRGNGCFASIVASTKADPTRCAASSATCQTAPHPNPLPWVQGRGDQSVQFAVDLIPSDPGAKKKHPKPDPSKPAPAKPAPATQPSKETPGQPAVVDATAGAEPRTEGNAIYRIDPEGFVTEVFRQPVLILSMVEINGALLVGTGGTEGQIYQVNPNADETVVLARVDAKQIMCLLASRDGQVYLGTANAGTVASMSSGYAPKGTFSSPVLDATQISRFGRIHLQGNLAAGAGITVATRSGNVKEAAENTWSKWTDDAPAAEYLPVASPSARFLQYRLTFTSADGKTTPVVHDISVAYQMPNLPPTIKAVKIATSAAGLDVAADADATTRRVESARRQTIAWDASDPNNDALTYSLYLRAVGEENWILLKDKLTDATYDWDTRTVADGRYEIKVVASDAGANPPGMGKTASRVSDPITVDNTPPVIGDVKSQQRGNEVQIDLKAVDRTSTVAAVDYSVDSGKDWQFVLPTDQIYDSPEETVSIRIADLKPGPHQVTIRATDSKGNQSYENLFIRIAEPTRKKDPPGHGG